MTSEERHAIWASLTPAQRSAKKRAEAIEQMEHPRFNAALVDRAQKRMDRVDAFPSDVRAVIYEHGLEIVQEFWNHGVKKAKSIEHLIASVLGSDYANGQHRFALNKSPNAISNSLNRVMVTVPREPTGEMIAASMAEVSTFDQRITKTEKHRRRLRAALSAAAKE